MCPQCAEKLTFSRMVADHDLTAYRNYVSLIRAHGLTYKGRRGEHTARPRRTEAQHNEGEPNGSTVTHPAKRRPKKRTKQHRR